MKFGNTGRAENTTTAERDRNRVAAERRIVDAQVAETIESLPPDVGLAKRKELLRHYRSDPGVILSQEDLARATEEAESVAQAGIDTLERSLWVSLGRDLAVWASKQRISDKTLIFYPGVLEKTMDAETGATILTVNREMEERDA